uniref:HMG box domain-containing protein n=1 Tax=Parascaris equorum TaxID=6256 RepID=A0A914RC15_PAREQ
MLDVKSVLGGCLDDCFKKRYRRGGSIGGGNQYELKPFGVTCCILEPGIFKTTLVNRDAMKKRIDGAWNKLTEKQREDYGVAFKDSCKTSNFISSVTEFADHMRSIWCHENTP